MLASRHRDDLLQQPPRFDDFALSLQATAHQPKGMLKETRKIIALARQFNQAQVKPHALDLDCKVQQSPDYLAEDFIRMANQQGLFTLWIPKIFGGKGFNLVGHHEIMFPLLAAAVIEEIENKKKKG